MKKQYHISESYLFKRRVSIYHDGELISSKEMWVDDIYEYVDELEEDGYVYGYTQDEVDEAKRLYEDKLTNVIEDEEDAVDHWSNRIPTTKVTAYQRMLEIKKEREITGYRMEDPSIVAEKTIEALRGFEQYTNSELLNEYKKMKW